MAELREEISIPAPKRFGRVPQLVELRAPGDDWTGVTRTADRRRRQNRLNQRAYRKRKQAQAGASEQLVVSQGQSASTSAFAPDGYLMIDHPRTRAVTYAFMQLAYMQYTLKNHRLTYLPSLIRLNAINALSENAHTIGLPLHGLCRDELISPFNALGPKLLDIVPVENTCPENMRPTALQQAVEHHPWTDLLPAPRLRDNVLNAITSGAIDEDELCADLMEISKSDEEDGPYLIVWGEASDVYNWEASIGFIKKWGGLLRGCPELIESTNRWRLKRGEKKLGVQV
ncbi:hypothetical protein NCS57_00679100 [Fusarium keratoplasticum]|uniref:Uncharacterized protein n=1 Tax=Fusarium keratoplasticum TaxID=1328300 RepID=A0ACC0QVA1_9HYPO|nr:hypothetical protein NCS57_00679100 [Fusarium keratoplasticum]KAI8668669.1 hypothetical protein NCS57_00679100 [Fusarium keratoplasticum]